jgi:DNA-binding protein H-NS
MPLITFLVGKMIFVTWEKSKSVCRKKCKEKVPAEEGHRRLRIKVCESQCKVAGYKNMISKLRSEVTKCQATENPEKCQTTLVKHLGKYNDMLRAEEVRLRRLTAQLNSKASVAKRQETAATRPPEIR